MRKRNIKFTLRLTEEELTELKQLADYYKNSESEVIYKLLNGAYSHQKKKDPLFFAKGKNPEDQEEEDLLKLQNYIYKNPSDNERENIAINELLEDHQNRHEKIKGGEDIKTAYKDKEELKEAQENAILEQAEEIKRQREALNNPSNELKENLNEHPAEQDKEITAHPEEPEENIKTAPYIDKGQDIEIKAPDEENREELIKELEEEKKRITAEQEREARKELKKSTFNNTYWTSIKEDTIQEAERIK